VSEALCTCGTATIVYVTTNDKTLLLVLLIGAHYSRFTQRLL